MVRRVTDRERFDALLIDEDGDPEHFTEEQEGESFLAAFSSAPPAAHVGA
jgi:hypothetical protein